MIYYRRLSIMKSSPWLPSVCLLLGLAAVGTGAQEWVSSVKILSDKVEDVSTMDAVLDWMIQPGMTDREKAVAIWETVVKFRHQNDPPSEFIDSGGCVHDPIKTFNVYGYNMCCCASACVQALASAAGFEARGWEMGHSVPEIYYGDRWHYADGSLVCYLTDATGELYSVDELCQVVSDNPGFNPVYGTPKSSYPEPFRSCEMADASGVLPARIHGLHSLWSVFGAEPAEFGHAYIQGYQCLLRIRRGEKLIRNWSNTGLHANMHDGSAPDCLNQTLDHAELRYQRDDYGDLSNGRVGNGSLVYTVPLGYAHWRAGACRVDNVAPGAGLAPQEPSSAAEAVFRMRCPYPFLTGAVRVRGDINQHGGASLTVYVSTNNGLDWHEAWSRTGGGALYEEIDIGARIFRRYDYRVKLVLNGDAAIDGLEFVNDIQHAQRALPALDQGDNTITVAAGRGAVDTITVAPSLRTDTAGKNEDFEDYDIDLVRVTHGGWGGLWAQSYGVDGDFVTVPVDTPGDITAVRFGGYFRNRGSKDRIVLQLSFDNGDTWIEAGSTWGPYVGKGKYVRFTDVPAGARRVLARYMLIQQHNSCGIFDLRVDVDYRDTPDGLPPAEPQDVPLKITYAWQETGAGRTHKYYSHAPGETYTIRCTRKPVMTSITVEHADADGDGMPDDWEEKHFGAPTNSSGRADEDWDRDGSCDLFECLSGTDPTNAGSVFACSNVTAVAGSGIVIRWQSAADRFYSISRASNLVAGFTDALAAGIAATPPSNTYTDRTPALPSFYRISLDE